MTVESVLARDYSLVHYSSLNLTFFPVERSTFSASILRFRLLVIFHMGAFSLDALDEDVKVVGLKSPQHPVTQKLPISVVNVNDKL